MRALVISGGGSKGAFAGGVAQYLIENLKYDYDIFVGTSTGSLLLTHLALKNIDKVKKTYTNVGQSDIFDNCPFTIKPDKGGGKQIEINHFNVVKNFIRGSKTFGESNNLRKLISKIITRQDFDNLLEIDKEIVVTVSNLSLNQVEYKSIRECSYEDFCDWIWISANFTPFMSLVRKNGCEYADGGFATMVPIEEAINRGATTVDVIILETEVTYYNRVSSRNVFSLITNLHLFMAQRIKRQNIRIGKLVAANKDVVLNFYYTPMVLTTNSLIFDKELMAGWWQEGFEYAKNKNQDINELKVRI